MMKKIAVTYIIKVRPDLLTNVVIKHGRVVLTRWPTLLSQILTWRLEAY